MAFTKSFICQLRLEPYLLIILFGMAIRMSTVSKLIQDKVCLNDNNFTATVCANLHEKIYVNELNKVTPTAQNYGLYEKLIISSPCLLLLFFAGSWMDKYKRAVKIILLVTTAASLLESVLLFSNSFYFEWPTWAILLCYIPAAVTGGRMITIMTTITQVTKESEQSMVSTRIALIDFCLMIGGALGGLTVGPLLAMSPLLRGDLLQNYTGIFVFSGFCDIISGLWILFAYKSVDIRKTPQVENNENVQEEDEEAEEEDSDNLGQSQGTTELIKPKEGVKFLDLWDTTNITDAFKIVLKKRPDNGRTKIFLVIVASSVILTCFLGPMSFGFQFTEKALHWDVNLYSKVNALVGLISNPLSLFCVFLFAKVLKCQDATLGIIGCTSIGLSLACKGIFLSEVGYFGSVAIGLLGALATVAGKSLIKPLVEQHEIGRLFIFVNIAELFVDLALSPLLTKVFNATFDVMPGFLYVLMGAMMSIPVLIFVYMRLMGVARKPLVDNVQGEALERGPESEEGNQYSVN